MSSEKLNSSKLYLEKQRISHYPEQAVSRKNCIQKNCLQIGGLEGTLNSWKTASEIFPFQKIAHLWKFSFGILNSSNKFLQPKLEPTFRTKFFLISPVYFLWSIWVRIIFKREIWCVFVCLFMCVYICVYVCVYVCVHLQTKRNGIIFCVEGVEERRQYTLGVIFLEWRGRQFSDGTVFQGTIF